MSSSSTKKRALMICLGNICRSPIAEAVLKETVKKHGLENEWEIDSAATASWEVGSRPDYRAQETLKKHGIKDYTHIARQIKKSDYEKFDYIFGMDESNMRDLKAKAPENCHAKILLLGDFGLSSSDRIIRDPYYDSGSEGFEKAYQQIVVACEAFINKVKSGEI